MQKHGTMLSALWILLLHVSPLRSMKFNLFGKFNYNSITSIANRSPDKLVSSLNICFVLLFDRPPVKISQLITKSLNDVLHYRRFII